jgi:alpha-D-ribose 1-methylphosphonate 5-triphosphate synthase subunit PhnH
MQESTLDSALVGGFANPPIDAALAFRSIMQAMARPGTIQSLAGAAPTEPLSLAAGATILTLCDTDTTLYLAGAYDCEVIRRWITFHTGARFSQPGLCHFALGKWADLMPLSQYPVGTASYPDRSATLIVESDHLSANGIGLKGPGIRETALLSLPEVEAFRANHSLYPLGLDFLFTCNEQIAALPRSSDVLADSVQEIV